jgi:ActR/RegA family two-component response regulator
VPERLLIDTLKLTQRLERRGVRREEAEAIAEGLAEALQGDIGIRFDKVDQRLESVEQRLAAIETRLTRLESDVRLLTWMVGVILAGVLALVLKTFFG